MGSRTLNGLACLILGVWFYPSNLLLIAWVFAGWLVRRAALLFVVLSSASTLWVLYFTLFTPTSDLKMEVGCYLWMAAHCGQTLALWLSRIVSAASPPPAGSSQRAKLNP
jgi:hypothetical protein